MALDPAAPALDVSSQLPSPRPTPPAALFFQPQQPPPLAPPLPVGEPSSPLPSPSPEDGAGWASDPEPSDVDPSSPDDEPTTSTGSRDGDRSAFRVGKAAARATGAKAVLIGSGMLHRLATKAESLERENGLYLADEEDAAAIGHPLADIASRRAGVAGKAMSADATDAVSAALGLAGFMSKQIALQLAIAQHKQSLDQGPVYV